MYCLDSKTFIAKTLKNAFWGRVHATLANVLFYTFLDSSLEPYLSDFPWIYKYNQTLPGCMNDGINFPT